VAGLDVDALGLRQHFVKGDYFVLDRSVRLPETALVYPTPRGPGLGIHLTTGFDGTCLVGPDATYVEDPADTSTASVRAFDYDVDPKKASMFTEAIARYLPGVSTAQLTPGYAGIRPKLSGPGEGFADFAIVDGAEHGVPGVVCLAGIESPGLTAAASLARRAGRIIA
jgi:L-2-hydroxyglutarate oxidase LhgO